MKTLQITLIVTLIVAIFLFSGLVSALNSNGLSAYPVLSKDMLSPGDTVTMRVTLQSNTDQQLQIQAIGVHFDWMVSDRFYNLSSGPVTIQSNGTYISTPFAIQIPSNVSIGSHTYYIGVDGQEETSQTDFSWDSSQLTVQVLYNTAQSTPTPNPTASPSGGGGQTQSPLNLLLYGTVIAVVAVIVIAVIVMMIGKKRRHATPVADQPLKPVEGKS